MNRHMIHLRQIEAVAFVRDDGLWEMELTLHDRKTRTFPGGAGDHPAGVPIHGMTLACTLSTDGTVTHADARMTSVPFEVSCRSSADDYAELIGLNVFDHFSARLKDRLGERSGCHHLTTLAGMLPTLAIQSFAGEVVAVRDDGRSLERPPALDGCRGLRTDGEAVRLYWPRWHQPAPVLSHVPSNEIHKKF